MLLRFTLENWMSFRDPATFSMIASKERQHGDRLPTIPKYATRVLPIAAIYGGNASGKTNFFKALAFARTLIVRGTLPDAPIPVEPFRLDAQAAGHPVRFAFELLIGDDIYAYTMAVTRRAVVEERLVLLRAQSEELLFDRGAGEPRFAKRFERDPACQYAFRGTRDNQLFLTNSVSQRLDAFRPVHDWFRDTLELIAPDARFGPIEHAMTEGAPLLEYLNSTLPTLDTGIARIAGEEVPLDTVQWPDGMQRHLQETLPDGAHVRLLTPKGEHLLITRHAGALQVRKLVTYHQRADGPSEKFDLPLESDGSRRLIDLLPALLDLITPGSTRVYVIDEIDRSLHTLIARRLLETHLAACGAASRSQLLVTTHDVLLMDQSLLRRDEMWVAERDAAGASTLTSFSEYKDVRYDKDLRKSYLQGRLGGVPRLGPRMVPFPGQRDRIGTLEPATHDAA